MIQIIRERQDHVDVHFCLGFDYVDCPGSGFSFPCDAEGKVAGLNPDAQANYQACLAGAARLGPVVSLGVQRYESHWTEPRVGLCSCGEEVELSGFTCTCDGCGADYNSSGQALAPREQWGEECNETSADILRGGDPFEGNDY